uniref:Uncharacterized protein n=1 Tax=Cryptomonas curvata TaxID=233186 RepID=A0A7S0ME84_9CRYP|mmetsp:Transcript_33637/g.70556  ORF Transcript_33637/g.70556 Transcript_33637/m.70556 type:complete len:301 (+) Transcript_33637:60-962(+)
MYSFLRAPMCSASGQLEVSQSGNSCGVDNDIDTGEILIGAASEICSGAGESEDMRTGHGSTWTGFPGRNEEEEDVKRLRQRAQDNVEFRSVCIAAPPHIGGRRRGGDSGGCSEGGLEMSISYRGRKGLVPDIEALVVLIPEVKFPRDTSAEAVVICTWEGLFHMWLQEVRWAVITQVSRSIWSKVKLRRTPKRSTDSERHDQPKLEPSHPAMQGTFSNLSDGQGSKPHKGLSTRLGSRHNLHIESGTENRQDDSTTPDSENPELEEAYRSYGIQLPQDSDGRSRQALVEASKSYGVLKPP